MEQAAGPPNGAAATAGAEPAPGPGPLSGVIHQLRHPLSTMILQLQLLERRLKRGPVDVVDVLKAVEELQDTTVEMKAILNELQQAFQARPPRT
jgi:hypothetical protein